MTTVTISKQNKLIKKVVCDGHTNYGVKGEDIVCSALSSIVQTAVLGVIAVAGVNVKMVRKEKEGFLSFELPAGLDNAQSHDCEVILQTMLCGISDLHSGYSDFIELEVK